MTRPLSRTAAAALALVAAVTACVVLPTSASARPAGTASTTATATAMAECSSTAVATAARLRVRITSTAPRVNVHLRPGQVTGRKDLSALNGATTAYVPDGVAVIVPAGVKGVVDTEIISVDPTKASTLTLAVDKGTTGSVTVQVWSASGYGTAATLSTSDTAAQVSVPRSNLFDPTYSLPKADSRRLVLAAYYPWFSATGWATLPVAETPLAPRSVWSPAGVLSMTQQARTNGVDGFVVSWMGSAKNGEAYDVAAAAAAQTNGVVAPYLEVGEALNRGGVTMVEQWLREALDHTSSASLTMTGAPVVFVWDMGKVAVADWTGILARLGQPVRIIGDADTGTHGASMQGWHTYLPPTDLTGYGQRNAFMSGWFRGQAALDSTLTPRANVATVSPGFDDRILRGADRPVVSRDGGRYDATWDAALAGDPDMVLITSWNEWYEGTEIEPGTRWGDAALQTTATRAAAWKASTPASCTTTTTTTTSTTTTTKKPRR